MNRQTHDSTAGRILVWDLPTRAFHWLLALSFAGAFVTAESERWRDVHVALGYAVVALVAFRLFWGMAGTRYARFRAWPWSPRAAVGYLRSLVAGRPEHHVGHNPAGSLAIYALIALAVLTSATGLATFNDIGGKPVEELHEGVANAMLALVLVHVAGVIVGSIAHRENLPAAMVSGRKRGRPADAIRGARPIAAALLVALILGIWTGAVPLPGLEPGATPLEAGRDSPAHARRHHDDR